MIKNNKKVFDPETWLTPNSYSNNFASLPNGAGVYLLVRATWHPAPSWEVLYVGQSINIAQRLRGHEIKKLCDRQPIPHSYVQIYFKRVAKQHLRTREKQLIKQLNPPFNLQHRKRGI
jgi:excinuclease UvrABC nuclease subunit